MKKDTESNCCKCCNNINDDIYRKNMATITRLLKINGFSFEGTVRYYDELLDYYRTSSDQIFYHKFEHRYLDAVEKWLYDDYGILIGSTRVEPSYTTDLENILWQSVIFSS